MIVLDTHAWLWWVASPERLSAAADAALLGREGLHGDPADRFICATARARGASLVTRDEALRRFDPQRAVW